MKVFLISALEGVLFTIRIPFAVMWFVGEKTSLYIESIMEKNREKILTDNEQGRNP